MDVIFASWFIHPMAGEPKTNIKHWYCLFPILDRRYFRQSFPSIYTTFFVLHCWSYFTIHTQNIYTSLQQTVYIYTQCVDILLLSDQFIGHSMDNHKSRTRGSSHARQNQNKHRSCISLSTLHQYGSSYMQIYCFMRRQHCRPWY